MSAVIIDYRTDDEIVSELKKLGYSVVLSTNNENVSSALSGHPDMQICKCGNGVFVCSPECYEYYEKVLTDYNVKLLCGKTRLKCNYPEDVAYNVGWIGDIALCNAKYTDSVVKAVLRDSGVEIINISQGYTKCNICVVSDSAVITSDNGIYNCLNNTNIDVLLINKAHIDIWNWEYGFIGGASGRLNDNKLAFCGNLSLHPDYDRIRNFCNNHGVECISLSNKRLMDLGSLILV